MRFIAARVGGITFVFLSLCFFTPRANAAKVLYIGLPGSQAYTRQQTEAAAHFYGLEIEEPFWQAAGTSSMDLHSRVSADTVAIVIAADALASLGAADSATILHKRPHGVPLLIAGINANTSPGVLQSWSSGAITACRRVSGLGQQRSYQIAEAGDVTGQLSGSTLPLDGDQVLSLNLRGDAGVIVNANLSGQKLPVFAATKLPDGETFFATEQAPVDIPPTADPYRQQRVFASLLAPMIFLHHAAGDRAWHSSAAYANFTIDDLWLREPYGHVSYPALLRQAEDHRFHVTIAFIPWNFDRSQPDVVRLFHDHPDRLSICIHGNDHVHQEFGDLETHPLASQARNAEQAIARMDRFSKLTQLPYDRVMVFPHSISPEATFPALRRAHYLATVNSLSVPSDATTPDGPEFALRTSTLAYAAFPSLRRYSAETDIPPAQLAIDAFLGNPMMFYAHESFFATGIGAFNNIADEVNRLQPATRWSSPGEIVQHLYLEKARGDGNVDVLALSNALRLRNSESAEKTFFITKREDSSVRPLTLVDGRGVSPTRAADVLTLRVTIPAGEERLVEFTPPEMANIASVDISRGSPRTTAIRLLSDFRDNVVSNSEAGRWFIRSYALHGTYWIVGIAFFAVAIVVVHGLSRNLRNRRPRGGRPTLIAG